MDEEYTANRTQIDAPEATPLEKLLQKPSYQQAIQKAKSKSQGEEPDKGSPTFRPPEKPVHQYTDGELAAAIATCPGCQGFGVIRPPADDLFVKLQTCPRCQVYTREKHMRARLVKLLPRIEQYSMLRGDLRHKRFDNFERGVPDAADPEYAAGKARLAAWTSVRGWAGGIYNQTPDTKQWLFLHGTEGSGKSHLAAAAANGLVSVNMPVIFSTLPELLGLVSADGFAAQNEIIRMLQTIPILIIDDIREGELQYDWVQSFLFRVLDRRYVERLPTLIASNLGLLKAEGRTSIQDYERRIADRIADNSLTLIVANLAPSWRQRPAL